MKKTAFAALFLSLIMLLSSCSIKVGNDNNNTSSNEDETLSKTEDMTLNTQYSLDKLIYFKLIKVSTAPLVYDTSGSGNGYEPFSNSLTYIDLILEVTNNSLEEYDCKSSVDLKAYHDSNGEEISERCDFVSEDGGWSLLSTSSKATVASGETSRIHCFIAVHKNYDTDKTFTFKLTTDEKVYALEYSPSMGSLGDITEIKFGETLTMENYANITLQGVTYSNIVFPTDTSGDYTYYETSDLNNIFLIFKFNVENLTTEAIDYDHWINGVAFFDTDKDKGYYVSGTIIEDVNKRDLYMVGDINPGESKILYVIFKVPSIMKVSTCNVDFVANREFLSYTVDPSQMSDDDLTSSSM